MTPFSLYQETLQGEFSAETVAWVTKSQTEEPFFPMAHFMHAKQQGDKESLFAAATYAPDRAQLKRYMEGKIPPAQAVTAATPVEHSQEQASKQIRNRAFAIVNFDVLQPLVQPQSVLSIAPTASPNLQLDAFLNAEIKIGTVHGLRLLGGIRAQLRKNNQRAAQQHSSSAPSRTFTKRLSRTDADRLLDSFLEQTPSMSRPVPAATPAPVAENVRKSVEEDRTLATETLAIIYAKQGDTAAAVEIYRKLCLVFPNKRAYFEAKISQLEGK